MSDESLIYLSLYLDNIIDLYDIIFSSGNDDYFLIKLNGELEIILYMYYSYLKIYGY